MYGVYLKDWIKQEIITLSSGKANQTLVARSNSLSRNDIEAYQLKRLRETLNFVSQNSSFYRKRFSQLGFRPEMVMHLSDIQVLPLTEPLDIAEEPYQFLCCSLSAVESVITLTTSGTTKKRKRIFYSMTDIEQIINFMSAGMRTVATSQDVVQIVLPGRRPFGQMDLLATAVEKIRASTVRAGTVISSTEQLKLIKENGTTILFGPPSRIYRITQELADRQDLKNTPVRLIFITSEYLAPSMARRIQDVWGCAICNHYGMTELGLGFAVECSEKDGFHCNEADFIVEVVDPVDGRPLPDGEEGFLVYTALRREAMPLIRYNSHDFGSISYAPCSCGATPVLKISKIRKRQEAIFYLSSGQLIYPALLDDVLYFFPEIIDYKVVLREKNGQEHLDLLLEVTDASLLRLDSLKQRVIWALAQELTVHINVDFCTQGQLQRRNRAKKTIFDERSIVQSFTLNRR
ncbi:phenylacetate--CoA ligase family protein [candidate division WWE3 bacterium]|uniref:Phenylacetate--CoA ligase family protein n=1 Tax=candidate division WWE3 bacterium TaxID=2053526 RepID=A0A3A4ZKM1_UNCKA|nr:MAG: phenylacetate--CoA ligase family protein [candidate division WWE3 bacterium]